MVGKQDKALALKIFQDGGHHNRVVDIYNELGRVDQAMGYAQKNGIKVDVGASLKTMIDSNP